MASKICKVQKRNDAQRVDFFLINYMFSNLGTAILIVVVYIP